MSRTNCQKIITNLFKNWIADEPIRGGRVAQSRPIMKISCFTQPRQPDLPIKNMGIEATLHIPVSTSNKSTPRSQAFCFICLNHQEW